MKTEKASNKIGQYKPEQALDEIKGNPIIEGQVGEQLKQLESGLKDLDECISSIGNRISPVCHGEIGGGPEDDAAPTQTLCQLASESYTRLMNHFTRLHRG